jgi:hypothetical protein
MQANTHGVAVTQSVELELKGVAAACSAAFITPELFD